MALSANLLEREGRSTVLDYTISLVCAKHKGGTFSLSVIESSDLGDVRHAIGKRIRSPKAFIEAAMSVMEWTELEIDYDVIVNEICVPLRNLDPEFADAVIDQVVADRAGKPVHGRILRA